MSEFVGALVDRFFPDRTELAIERLERRLLRESERLEHKLLLESERLRKVVDEVRAAQREPRVASVLLLGETIDEEDIYASWSWRLGPPPERYRARVQMHRPVKKGAWLLGANGTLISNVTIGSYVQSACGCSTGPIVRLANTIQIAMDIQFTLSFGPLDEGG